MFFKNPFTNSSLFPVFCHADVFCLWSPECGTRRRPTGWPPWATAPGEEIWCGCRANSWKRRALKKPRYLRWCTKMEVMCASSLSSLYSVFKLKKLKFSVRESPGCKGACALSDDLIIRRVTSSECRKWHRCFLELVRMNSFDVLSLNGVMPGCILFT